jgi:ABC-type nitrate/sulfonate/bicarbonate transport system ATPase subunit
MNRSTPMVYCGPVWRFTVRVAPEIVLSDEECEALDELIRSKLTSVRLALRARIVLAGALS